MSYDICHMSYLIRHMVSYVCLQYVKSTAKMDVCLRDNLILFRCFAKTSKVNLQLPIVILKNRLFRHASSYHVHVGYINFQQTLVSPNRAHEFI